MLDKLKQLEEKYNELEKRMAEPEVYSDPAAYAKLAREQKELAPVVEAYRRYERARADMAEAQELMGDPEMKEMAQEEFERAKAEAEKTEDELRILLLPRDPNDSRNVIVEIRGGAGGDEAALFAGSLFRMYSMYADSKGWKTEIANINETEIGASSSRATAPIRGSSSRAGCTACSACRRRRPPGAYTRAR